MIANLLIFFILVLGGISASAANTVTFSISDSIVSSDEKCVVSFCKITNYDNRTTVVIDVVCQDEPFTIHKVEWVNGGKVCLPLEPFSLTVQPSETVGKNVRWHISIDFPFSTKFWKNDKLVLFTDSGKYSCQTSVSGTLDNAIMLLREDYEQQLADSQKTARDVWTILLIVIGVVVVAGLAIFVTVRRRFVKNRNKIEELSLLIVERTGQNRELEAKVASLYGSRFDTLNMLCNEYFEKSESDKLKIKLYNEVEKHILSLRDSKSVNELESIVNTYLDNILVKIKKQIPSLTVSDLRFLTYLYAGFSPRAVCILTDIKLKNFYNKRSRLKTRILDSDAEDKDFFASKI